MTADAPMTATNAPAPAGMVGEEEFVKLAVDLMASGRYVASETVARKIYALFAPLAQEVERLRGDGWQDISTAPRDGTRFLATGGGLGSDIDFASYNDRVGCWNTTYFTLDDTDHEPDGYCRPTHWHPLLARPAAILALAGETTGKEG